MMNWLRAFMAGRNGLDRLGTATLIAAVVVNLLSRMTNKLSIGAGLSFVAIALMAYMLFRFFSRNLDARRREDARFMQLFSRAKGDFAGWKTRRSQSSEYKFFTCPSCRTTLRVPRGHGKIKIVCRKCGNSFTGKS